ncbi:putative hydroxymethylpyrimidine transport system substrate-binding protein [Bisgaardia hudsonensis]|uniref:Putative hydroxymethylpyrimidine transport system substrate-binding protein n=1 Tax=Bisgaardia hudsonensis TaxID=109472 RepID=A0A4R2N1U0_9PAST|nr:ABC transporter substrate-binding protein [Bisgaardia hudsonensis]QLB12922.1 thiamine biosynthesis protein [Bisgaardia hudsonensis]TCP13518.1 putative hydroxymethylpyrimidine transport system substrate-binding protein [Bisgaardia hudsonensis]
MKKLLINLIAIFTLFFSNVSLAKEKLTLLLDWFVNPDHAAIIVAQQKGFFEKNGLIVEIVEPADPSMPPKLVAAGKADLAVDYQPQLQLQVAEGLPLVRVGTLVSTPLNSLTILADGKIKTLADLKGKKVGYSVSGFESVLLGTMLESVNLSEKDVEFVNVNWSLSPSLFSGQVDAVIGAYRNFELNQMALEKRPGKAFYPEEYGVPAYDELILVAKKETLPKQKISTFLTALEQATIYLINHPEESWNDFVSYKPKELDNELNRLAWKDTLPRLALRPRALDNARYQKMAEFMQQKGLIKTVPNLTDYAIQVE